MTEETKPYNENKIYIFGDRVIWQGKERILVVGSSHGVAPSDMYLIWKKYGE